MHPASFDVSARTVHDFVNASSVVETVSGHRSYQGASGLIALCVRQG